MTENEIGKEVVCGAIAEYRKLGPGVRESVDEIVLAHIQTCFRLTGRKLGFLLNFGALLMKEDITRAVNSLKE